MPEQVATHRPIASEYPQAEVFSGFLVEPPKMTGQASPDYEVFYYHVDHLGTPRLITTASGDVESYHKYAPFGEEIQPVSSENSHQFTGHERDEDTGLDYMLARYYASGQGRFLSVDPLASSADPNVPQTWNRYTYAANSPLKFVDPDGQDIELAADGRSKAARKMLIRTAMRPTGRAMLQKVDSDKSITVTVRDKRITSPQALAQVKRGDQLTMGTTRLTGVKQDPQGNVTHRDVDVALDTTAIQQVHPTDPSGVATTSEEMFHANDHRQGKTDAQVKAGDLVDPATGTSPAGSFADTVANEQPDITKRRAKKLVKQLLKP
jgi:RHS repeat-associated protein